MKNTTTTTESEMKRRMDLVNDKDFVRNCAAIAKKVGITAAEWNSNKAALCMMWANEICGIENKMTNN